MSGRALTTKGLKQLIIQSLNLDGVTPEMIGDDEPLFQGGLGLDSVDALELVVALEKHLGIKIRSHEVEPESLASVSSMLRFAERCVAQHQGVSG